MPRVGESHHRDTVALDAGFDNSRGLGDGIGDVGHRDVDTSIYATERDDSGKVLGDVSSCD
jgi:hypothetical protein